MYIDCIYLEYFREYAEKVPDGQSCVELSKWAQENKVYLVGGSIPEVEGDKLYNTCTIWVSYENYM